MSLIHDQIEFHNTVALETFNGIPGLCPMRFPRALRPFMNYTARTVPTDMAGVELRFVTQCPQARIALTAHAGEVVIHIYCGNFHQRDLRIPPGTTHVLQLEQPAWFSKVPEEILNSRGFSHKVWRLQISYSMLSYLGVETFGDAIRPPTREEKPRLKYLAYGSSITHSFAGGYPYVAARQLGVDVLNKGLSGSCHIEPQTADFLADQVDWDFATLELGVNMRMIFSPEEFEQRSRYLVQRLRAAKPAAPLFLITHFTNRDHYAANPEESAVLQVQEAFDTTLRRIAQEYAHNSVYLLEGREILSDFTGLSVDLLHPSSHGHTIMGENLARMIEPVLFRNPS